jgi:hypothetical protein
VLIEVERDKVLVSHIITVRSDEILLRFSGLVGGLAEAVAEGPEGEWA